MANIRDLKKDINFLCSEFVADCFLMLQAQPEKESDIDTLIDKVIDARYQLVNTIHNPENKRKRNIRKNRETFVMRKKTHKKNIQTDFENFLKLIDDSYEQLQKLSS